MTRLPESLRRSAARLGLTRLAHRVGSEERGAVTVIVAMMMVVILGMAALVVDVGSIEVRKAQLQDAADAAATAIAQDCFAAAGTTVDLCDPGVVGAASVTALAYASRGFPTGTVVTVATPTWTTDTVEITLSSPDASFFGGIFGVTSSNVVVHATAKWGLPATPLALAYNECNLPAPAASKAFLRYDLLALDLQGCGLIGGVINELGNGWMATPNCTFDVNLLSYLGNVLTKVLPTNCAPILQSLIGKYVLLPVYNHVLTNIVVNGVLLGQGYAVQKYALVQVTGYDFSTLTINGAIVQAQVGPADISGSPQCPTVNLLGLITVKEPTCQGLQGVLLGYLTPTEAAARMHGVQLIS